MNTAPAYDLEPWCAVVRSEFAELPSLRLTLAQAEGLWSLDEATCRRVLEALVADRFLLRTTDSRYCRADCIDGETSID
jgi:hypothetical protein